MASVLFIIGALSLGSAFIFAGAEIAWQEVKAPTYGVDDR